jgi:hypothetical protein
MYSFRFRRPVHYHGPNLLAREIFPAGRDCCSHFDRGGPETFAIRTSARKDQIFHTGVIKDPATGLTAEICAIFA